MMAEPKEPSQDLKVELVKSHRQRKAMDTIKVHRSGSRYEDDALEISFQRTLRVADNSTACELPPSLGTFPLYPVSKYQKSLPNHISSKGGLFFPMYRKCEQYRFLPSKLSRICWRSPR